MEVYFYFSKTTTQCIQGMQHSWQWDVHENPGPTVCYTPYGLFWCVWVSVGCVYHVLGLRHYCQSIHGETCRLNTLSHALYLTPGWFNSTPFTHIHKHTHLHTHPLHLSSINTSIRASIDPLHPASSAHAVKHQGQDNVGAGLISDRFTIKPKLLFNSSGHCALFDLAPWEGMSYSWREESAETRMVGARFITQLPNV